VSRFAEAHWHQQPHEARFPVLVVPGMVHGQFAVFDGPPPTEVAVYDLPPEVATPQAQAAAAALTATYLSATLGGGAAARAALAAAQADSAAFLAPLVAAQVAETSYHLLPPCYDAPPSPACAVGSAWAPRAQARMTNLAGGGGPAPFAFGGTVADAMHPVDGLAPTRLPAIANNCSAPTAACTLNMSTVTENSYDAIFDALDVALYPVTAHELKVKLTSRQNGLIHAGVPGAEFNQTDGPPLNTCADINAATFAWALANAAPATVARYRRQGLPLRFGDDLEANAVPQFTFGSLTFALANATDGTPFVWVNATTLRTPADDPAPASAGLHYCILLSPARAMEWIYVDSNRKFVLE
jgi:hypothetical protein